MASKGGNYLLDVGPTAQGVIPVVAEQNLLTVGRWLKVNGEAVYGAGLSPFGEGFNRHFEDWRCTTKPGKLFFTVFHWPSGGLKLPAFKNAIKKVYLLADASQTEMPVVVSANGERTVQNAHYAPDVMASVFVVEIEGDKAEVEPAKH